MPRLLKFLVIFICISTLIAFFAGSFFLNKKADHVHIHAGFVVFENNKKLDFSDFKYMQVSPCDSDGKPIGPVDEQLEKAHLHDQVGDVVHVHRKNAKWKDLFTNIKFPIGHYKEAYINGEKIEDFENLNIVPYDSLVILIGDNDVTKALDGAVIKSHILEAEKRSENCGV